MLPLRQGRSPSRGTAKKAAGPLSSLLSTFPAVTIHPNVFHSPVDSMTLRLLPDGASVSYGENRKTTNPPPNVVGLKMRQWMFRAWLREGDSMKMQNLSPGA